MSFPNMDRDDDAYWRQPEPQAEPSRAAEPTAPDGYSGPPRAQPPAPHWQPPMVVEPPQPRNMPGQDLDAIDESEGAARTLTYGVALVAGAVAVLLICLLCGRLVF